MRNSKPAAACAGPAPFAGALVLLWLVGSGLSAGLGAAEVDPELAKIRQEAAVHYFDPAARLALAGYFHRHGQDQLAFYNSEETRKSTTRLKEYFDAFEKEFNGIDLSAEAEKRLTDAYTAKKTGEVALKIAHIRISHDQLAEALQILKDAMAIEPTNGMLVQTAAAVLARQEKEDDAQKLFDDFIAAHPDSVEATKQKVTAAIQAGDPDGVNKAEEAAIAKHPKESWFYYVRGMVADMTGDSTKSDADYEKAAQLSPDNAEFNGAAANHFFYANNKPDKAIQYYLRAYFVNYDLKDLKDLYVEADLRRLFWDRGQARYLSLMVVQKTDLAVVLTDADPVTVTAAMTEAKKHWDPKYIAPLFALWGSDDPNHRAQAMDCLNTHSNDAIRDKAVALLKDPSPYKQGMAMYVVMKTKGEAGIADIKPFLTSDIEMLRYDASSALLEFGGAAGKQVVLASAAAEKNPWWRDQLLHHLVAKP